MKEMRLFEVGFKEKPESLSYTEKFYVAASDAGDAIAKARLNVVEAINHWWKDNEGREEMIYSAYADDKEAPEDISDAECLASEKYQEAAQKIFDDEMERVKNLYLAKVLDIGTLIV